MLPQGVALKIGGKMEIPQKELLMVGLGVGIIVLLRNMLARTLNPMLASLKIIWPA
jgi:hypothetical protein